MPAPPLAPNACMRWSVVRKIIGELRPATILEIGCGLGALGARLARSGCYTGIEPDRTSFSVAQARIEPAGGHVLNTASDDLPDNKEYDLVCAFEVLEHIEDDAAAVKSWSKLISPGGHLLLSMPAWQERFNQWDSMVGHYRRYSPESATELLSAAGYSNIRPIVYGWPLGYALEAVRSKVAARRGHANEAGPATMSERTASSARHFQPKTLVGKSIEVATLPFAALQRVKPTHGTGIVVTAQRR